MPTKPQGQRRSTEPRGVNKSALLKRRRNTDEAKKEKAAAARKEQRRLKALAEVADEERRLNARISNELAQAAVAVFSEDRTEEDVVLTVPSDTVVRVTSADESDEQLSPEIQAKRNLWTLADARHLMRQGYTLEAVMDRTGWPADMLEGVKAGVW